MTLADLSQARWLSHSSDLVQLLVACRVQKHRQAARAYS